MLPREDSISCYFGRLTASSREGLQKTIYYLQQLDDYGVKFHSYTEEFLNTDNELARDILLSWLNGPPSSLVMCAKMAVECADALIAELVKRKDEP